MLHKDKIFNIYTRAFVLARSLINIYLLLLVENVLNKVICHCYPAWEFRKQFRRLEKKLRALGTVDGRQTKPSETLLVYLHLQWRKEKEL